MAFSNSIKRSQDILVCGLCDVNTKLKVKCMDCDLYLCDDCEERHSRFKNADSHSVLPIRDIHLHKEKDTDQEFKSVKCKIHKEQFCSIFCKTCKCLICPICNIERHQKHDLDKIDGICKKKYEELTDLENHAEKRALIFLQTLRKNNNLKYTEIETVLESKVKAIHEIQSRHVKKLNEIKTPHHISETEDKILKEENYINETKKEMKQLLELKNAETFLDAASTFEERLKKFCETLDSSEKKVETFQSISGEYSPLNSIFSDAKIELTKLQSFAFEQFEIYSITSNQMDSVWIADFIGGNCIQHLKLTKGIKVEKSHRLPENGIYEIRCFNDKEILLTISSKILRMTADGKFETFKDLSPSKVFTLHVTSYRDVVVGMDLGGTDKKRDELVIVILRSDGKAKYKYRNSGGQLLQNDIVRSCTVLDAGVICYIDSVGVTKNGRIVVLQKTGYIQWTYNGNSKINTESNPFTPVEVISTSNNNIIVSDQTKSAFHVLTSTGSLMTILDLTLIGICEPSVMTLVNDKCLWVYDEEKSNETLFKLEISGV